MRSFASIACSLIFMSSATHASQMIGYHAEYDVSLASRTSAAEITSINGKTTYQLTDSCDGWDAVEDYLMKFTYQTGDEYVLISHFASWEQYDGDLYSFEITEESNYEDKLDFGGFAQASAPALVSFSQNPEESMDLPNGVVFPIRHTEEILKRAQNGEKTYFADVFIGAEPDRALKQASTIIGQKQASNVPPDIKTSLISDDVWPIQIAYFMAENKSGLPEYELSIQLQDNGIVQSYAVDYGDFVLQADLKSLKAAEDPSC